MGAVLGGGAKACREVSALEPVEESQLFIQQAYVLHPAGTKLSERMGCKCCVGHRACSRRPHQLLAEADKQTKVTPSGRAVIKSSEAPGLPAFEHSELVEGGGSLEGPASRRHCMLLLLSPTKRDEPPQRPGESFDSPYHLHQFPRREKQKGSREKDLCWSPELPVFYDPSIPLFMHLFIFLINFYWNIIAVQGCGFTAERISYTYTYIPSFWISFPFRSPQSTESSSLWLYSRFSLVISFIHSINYVYMSITITQRIYLEMMIPSIG